MVGLSEQQHRHVVGHLPAAAFELVGTVVLIVVAEGTAAKWAAAVFATTSLLLFGNSALYHRFDWKPRTKMIATRSPASEKHVAAM